MSELHSLDGVAAEFLRSAAKDGLLVRTTNNGLIVSGTSTNPLTGDQSVFVQWYKPGTDIKQLIDESLLMGAEVILRVAAETTPPAGAEKIATWIVAPPAKVVATKPLGEGRGTVEPATASDDDFIHRLLCLAVADGYDGDAELSEQDVSEYVDQEYGHSISENPDLESFVLWLGQQRVGHITFAPNSVDEVTGETFVEVVDSFVLAEFRGSGRSDLLAAAVGVEAQRLDRRLLGHVSGDDGRLVAILGLVGWTPFYSLWRTRSEESSVLT